MSISSGSSRAGLATLFEACEAHRKEHERGQAGGEAKATCITILQRLKSVLPRLLKAYFTPRTASVADVQGMCQLMEMVLSKTMCEHGDEVFEHGELRVVAPRIFSTFHLLVLPRLAAAHHSLLHIGAQLLNLVQTSDLTAYDSLFADLVVMLQDAIALLRLLLRSDVSASDLLTPDCRLATFQGTLRIADEAAKAVADGSVDGQERPHQRQQQGNENISVTSSTGGLDAEAAFIPLPSVHALFLLLFSSTRMVTTMLTSSEVLASSPAAWSLCRALSTQLLLTAHPRILSLHFLPPDTEQQQQQQEEENTPRSLVQSLQYSTITALDVLLSRAATTPPETVQVNLVASILEFVNRQVGIAQNEGEREGNVPGGKAGVVGMHRGRHGGGEGSTKGGREGGREGRTELCELSSMATLLRLLLALFGGPSSSSTSLETLLPIAVPGLVASLRLCLPSSIPSSIPSSSFSSGIHLHLIRHALFRAFHRALTITNSSSRSSSSILRHLPPLLLFPTNQGRRDGGRGEGWIGGF